MVPSSWRLQSPPGQSGILEFELIQTQMAQKPVLRAEVYAHAMRASQKIKKEVRREVLLRFDQ